MNLGDLERVARAMVADGKGILAADESSGTIKKRFDGIKLESTEEHRRNYREMLFTAPGAKDSISGVIFYDETLRQKTKDGVPFAEYLGKLGIIPGIKVDMGAKALAGFPNETITEGLDGLRERLIEYYKLGARFAKWRAVHRYRRRHSDAVRDRSERACARALRGAVPGAEHRADRRARSADGWRAHAGALRAGDGRDARSRVRPAQRAPRASRRHGAEAEHGDLGQEGREARLAQEVAEATVRCLKRHVPGAVPGIAFLSGGQSSAEATMHLSLMNQLGPLPWKLTFSYGARCRTRRSRPGAAAPRTSPPARRSSRRRAKLNGLASASGPATRRRWKTRPLDVIGSTCR